MTRMHFPSRKANIFAGALRTLGCALLTACLAITPAFSPVNASLKAYAADGAILPVAYYLTNAGYVTPVKMQNPWGDCWSFAVASAVESSILKETADIEEAEAIAAQEAAAAAEEAAKRESQSADAKKSEPYDVTKKVDVDPETGKLKRGGEPMDSPESASSGNVSGASSAASPSALASEASGTLGSQPLEADDAAGSTSLNDAAALEKASQPATIDMSRPQLLDLNDSIDISERAIAWLVHELQTQDSAGTQAGEGYRRINPSDPMTQLAEGNFDMIGSQLVARQGLVAESLVPYRYNDYGGDPLWYSTGSSDGASDDARLQDWAVDPAVRTNLELGWVVSGICKMPSPAQLDINYATGLSTYEGYDANATKAIKEALLEIGGVAIALEADVSLPSEVVRGNLTDAVPSGHFTYSTWSQYNGADVVDCNHAATIVGWDDEYSASNFAGSESGQPPANGAWLCKNNWGSDALYSAEGNADDATHWGLTASSETGYLASPDTEGAQASGFFWLSYYDHSILNPMAFEVTPVDDDFENVYQYDYLGSAEFSKPATYNGDVWVANMYEAKDLELIEAVSAQTFAENDSVDVVLYMLPVDADPAKMPADEIFEAAEAVSRLSVTCKYAGFHTIALERPIMVAKGQSFIVAEHVYAKSDPKEGLLFDNSYLNLELSYLEAEGTALTTQSRVVANEGETFICLPDGDWLELNDFAAQNAQLQGRILDEMGVEFGNALIKTFTSTTSMAKINQIYESIPLE